MHGLHLVTGRNRLGVSRLLANRLGVTSPGPCRMAGVHVAAGKPLPLPRGYEPIAD
jgi:phosphoglycolate phosphatase-like HAD superfamily hydrolase